MMKTLFRIIVQTQCIASLLLLAASCNRDEIRGDSLIADPVAPATPFDEWLLVNYTYPYNIDFKWRLDYVESDMDYQLAPAREENAIALAKLVKYLWLEAYNEHAGVDFLRTYVPRVIHLIGSGAYNTNGTVVLGVAEGGMKITLYAVNDLDIGRLTIDDLNEAYLRTMHHEFAHILHQTKNYPVEFQLITATGYIGEEWSVPTTSADIDYTALTQGFISAYSRKAPDEDFVELIANFVVNTPQWWSAKLANAGDSGRAFLEQKLDMVRAYLKSAWRIDLEELRRIVQERAANLGQLELHL